MSPTTTSGPPAETGLGVPVDPLGELSFLIEIQGREIGRFALDAPVQGRRTARVEGKYVVVWKKTADGWRLDTDIWNLNR